MNKTLESRYRKLFFSYPASYRAEREDEIISTLLAESDEQQRWPTVRDARTLIASGMHTRARLSCGSTRRGAWRQGTCIATLILLEYSAISRSLLLAFGGRDIASHTHSAGNIISIVFTAIALGLMLRGKARLALIAYLPLIVTSVLQMHPWDRTTSTGYWSMQISPLLSSFCLTGLLAVCCEHSRGARTIFSWKLPTAVLFFTIATYTFGHWLTNPTMYWVYIAFIFSLLAVSLGVGMLDPRFSVAATIIFAMQYLIVLAPNVMTCTGCTSRHVFIVWQMFFPTPITYAIVLIGTLSFAHAHWTTRRLALRYL